MVSASEIYYGVFMLCLVLAPMLCALGVLGLIAEKIPEEQLERLLRKLGM